MHNPRHTQATYIFALIVLVPAAIFVFVSNYRHTNKVATTTPSPTVVASNTAVSSPSSTPTASATPTPTAEEVALSKIVSQTGVVWQKPTKVDDLHVMTVPSDSTATYYRIGTYNSLPMYNVNYPAMISNTNAVLYGDSTTGYSLVTSTFVEQSGANLKPSNYKDGKAYSAALKKAVSAEEIKTISVPVDSVAFDNSLVLNALQNPKQYTLNSNIVFSNSIDSTASGPTVSGDSSTITDTLVSNLDWGSLYLRLEISKKAVSTERNLSYVLVKPNGVESKYSLDVRTNTIKDDGTLLATKTDGSAFADPYRYDGYIISSCGSSSDIAVMPSETVANWERVGTTSGGKAILAPNDATNNAYVKSLYTQYKQLAQSGMSIATYVSHLPVLAIENPTSGYFTLLRNSSYGQVAECGKPVVYLYPTTDQQVNVSVNAVFHHYLPIPNLGSTGWSVYAHTNGQLDIGGASFPYLYWSGLGSGPYTMPQSGTVVKQDEAASTIHQQMLAQGFTEKETADFMEFWVPRLPKTTYVRLSWLGKNEMDILAPMSISPTPDTVIRAFLDFEGLNQPVSIPPQHFVKVERRGFTAVEWGGLLVK